MSAPPPLYLDNAATTFPKPPAVHQAMAAFAADIGVTPGRGHHAQALAAADLLAHCRRRLNQLLNGQHPNHVIFTQNGTDALNLAIKGILTADRRLPTAHYSPPTAHCICTHSDHNSVLRPLATLESRGEVEVTRLPIDPATAQIDPDDLRRAIRPRTRLIAVPHASNVTGVIQPIRAVGQIAREHDIPFLVDAAQTAGHLPIDVQADLIDLCAAPGHKALLGPLGTGVLYVRPGVEKILRPQREGGTGTDSRSPHQPDTLPEKYEAGSHNAIGLAGLNAALEWIINQGVDTLRAHDQSLTRTFLANTADIPGLTLYGPLTPEHRVGVVGLRIDGLEPYELAAILESHYNILTRPGLHCAPLTHDALGTTQHGGTTRLSFGPFVTPQDITRATDALAEIAAHRAPAGP